MVSKRGVNLADDASLKDEKEPYGGCSLVVRSKDGGKEIAQVATDKEGRFRVNLPAGEYILDLKHGGRVRLRAAPKPFTIVANQTVHADLDIESAAYPM